MPKGIPLNPNVAEKVCPKCTLKKDLNQFGPHRLSSDGVQSWCRRCTHDIQTARVARNHAKVRAYKLEHGCADCGYRDNPLALQLDHLDPTQKTKCVSQMITYGWGRILEELEKCEVVCANCHVIRTATRAGWVVS